MAKQSYCILLLFFLSFQQVTSQDFTINVQHIGIEEGLLHRNVQTIFEDKNGFMWVGTDKSIQRYDGHNFKTWTKADRTGLLYYISSIGQDDEGWLWLWNNDLLHFVFLHPETEEILTEEERFGKNFPIYSNTKNPDNWDAGSIIKNSKGQLCFGTMDGKIITYDSKNGFQVEQIERNISAGIIHVDEEDNFLIASDLFGQEEKNEFLKVSPKGKILASYPYDKNWNISYSFSFNKKIYYSLISDDGKSPQRFIEIDAQENAKELSKYNTLYSSPLLLNGKFWLLHKDKGWQIYDDLQFSNLIHTIDISSYHPSIFEYPPFVDSKGFLWFVGSQGLSKMIFQPSRFKKHFAFDDENKKPFDNSARGFWVDGDTIFVNFERSKTVRFNKNDPENWQTINQDKWARPLLKKENNELWLGLPFSIKVIKSDGKLVEEYPAKQGEIFSGIWSFFEDQNKRLWIGSGEDLVYKNHNEHFIRKYQTAEDPFDFISRRGAIQNMIPTSDGKVWFCSWTGLYLFDPIEEKILARYASDEKGKHYLPAKLFYYLYQDAQGIYWIGTADGLIRWEGPDSQNDDTNNNTFTNFKIFNRSNGFSNEVIYAIFEDDHNRLWMSSDYGIMSFHKETYNVKAYLPKDGISHHEFNRTSQLQDKDGTIYFGGLNGITSFHPDDFKTEKKDYVKMLVSDFEIFDGNKNKILNKVGALRNTNSITFHPNDRFFRLKFVLPTFEDVSQILYAWKVEGVDEDWNYQKENSLQIGVLPYGTHSLRVKGQSGGGGWSPHELAIQVHVLKPFYLKMWFLILAVFSILAGAFAFYKWRTYQYKVRQKLLESEVEKATEKISQDKKIIEKQAEELKQLDKVKSRFFANVSHELRTPLTLMLGPISSILKSNDNSNKSTTLLKMAQQNGKDLLKLVGSILDLSKMEAGKLELNEEPELLFPLVRRIISNFESHAQRANIRFVFNYKILKELQFEIDKTKLEIILNNLLSNAMKFTQGGGKVIFQAEDLENALQFSVKDTGRGIHPDDLPHVFDRFYQSLQPDAPTEGGTGIGLALSQEYVKMMNGKIWVESEFGQGCIFYFQLPRKEVLGHTTVIDDALIEEVDTPIDNNFIPVSKTTVAPNNKNTILVIEDNYSLRNYLETILSPHFNLITAENGQVGLDILSEKINSETQLPDLILSDIMMPVMDGYQLLKVLRSKDYFKFIPVVMLTARADIQDKLTALRIGVDDYLLKPFEEEELLVRIDNLLKNYAVRKASQKEVVGKEPVSVLEMEEKNITSSEQEWLEKLEKTILENIDDSRFNMDFLGEKMNSSRRQLQRKTKQIVGLTPKEYINEIRLYEARRLLETGKTKTIKATASKVGFADPQYFSIQFKERFGKVPSEYLN